MSAPNPVLAIETVADLLQRLVNVSPERIRFRPLPGAATEKDVLSPPEGSKRLYELVDGLLVEKAVGYYESRLALVLASLLEAFAHTHQLGIVLGADAPVRLRSGIIRLPDVSFVARHRLPELKVPRQGIPDLIPDLAVEVIGQGNTREEMHRKLREYFAAGVKVVWYVYPESCSVRIYSDLEHFIERRAPESLDGGELLPGFSLEIAEWFARADPK